MPAPNPTWIFRFIHIDNLSVCLRRGGLHAPNCTPDDGLVYRTIHDPEVQRRRHIRQVPCGPCGSIHDYVPFYFGYLSPMLLRLKTGRVEGYTDGQEPLIYLASTAQAVQESGCAFVFSDGHGIARFTQWFDDLNELDNLDWDMVRERYWQDSPDDNDRQRRKQAEFLVHRCCDWSLIKGIAVINETLQRRVEEVLNPFPPEMRRPVAVRPKWYY